MADFFGTNGVDTFTGTAGLDFIQGFPPGGDPNLDTGNDTFFGLGGDDAIYGGGGNDFLDGGDNGPNGDHIYGGAGADTLIGGAGINDTAHYEASTAAVRRLGGPVWPPDCRPAAPAADIPSQHNTLLKRRNAA